MSVVESQLDYYTRKHKENWDKAYAHQLMEDTTEAEVCKKNAENYAKLIRAEHSRLLNLESPNGGADD